MLPPRTPSDPFTQAYQAAVAQYSSGNFSAALASAVAAIGIRRHPNALNIAAAAAYSLGDMAAAEQYWRDAISVLPSFAEAYNNLGSLLEAKGGFGEAEKLLRKALALQPKNPSALHNLGRVQAAQAQYEAAEKSYNRALQLSPKLLGAMIDLGSLMLTTRRFAEAEAVLSRAAVAAPADPRVYFGLGNAQLRQKKYADALASFEHAAARAPGWAEPHNHLGNTLQELGRLEEAAAAYRKAIALKADFVDPCNNLSNVLRNLGHLDEAVAAARRAIDLNPALAEPYNNLGNALQDLGRAEEAVAAYHKAIDLNPRLPDSYNNLGNALQGLERLAEAVAAYDQAIELRADFAESHNNRGNALKGLGRLEEAIGSYQKAIDLKSDYADAHFNQSMSMLKLGLFESGWAEYEWRWHVERTAKDRRNFDKPLWLGAESLAGKTILLHAEQGLGDTIQFCRYAALVAALGATVVLEVQRPLVDLLSSLQGIGRVVARGEALPAFDYHCPLLSLPLVFGTNLQSIPAHASYLKADPQHLAKWESRLGPRTARRIGFVWAGRATNSNDFRRSIPLKSMMRLMRGAHQNVSLQLDMRPGDRELLAGREDICNFGVDLADFSDTAALIALLDDVVTVDTSVAHLAGALGRPVSILLHFDNDWRWLTDRTDSPWYPSARLFRQRTIGDWVPTIENVAKELGL